MKPITPEEARKNKVPDYVIQSFNELIAENIDNNGRSRVMQNQIITRILSKNPDITRTTIFNNNWLDVEPIFRRAGWKVEYDKPGYNEDYEASFTFLDE